MSFVMLFLCLMLLGAVSGLLAGLLGVGGGIILVPGLLFVLGLAGYSGPALMHMAVGTSLFVIIFTGLASARAHWKKEAVDLMSVKRIGVGVVAGVLVGSFLASILSGDFLKMFFACALVILAGVMVFDPARLLLPSSFLGRIGNMIAGFVIATVSTLVGIGGGTMSVPYMHAGGLDIKRAIGSAAALGVIIVVPAALGFMLIGMEIAGRPPYSLGYVNFLAAAVIAPVSMVCAPLGARLAHNMDVDLLRRVFAGFMVVVATKLWLDVLL